jgi:hypothetical protein
MVEESNFIEHQKKLKMNISKKSMLSAIALAAVLFANAQSAEEVINKHFEAIGGKEKISQIKSLYMESSVQVQGNEAPNTITILNGKGYRLDTEFNGQKIIQVYTDKNGWALNPMAGSSEAQALPEDQYKAGKDQIDIGGPLLNYSGKGNKVELQAKEEGSFKIKETNKDGITSTFYIDPTTYYITKVVSTGNMMGQEIEITRTYSNYQKTEYGYTMPFTIDISYGAQFNMTSTVKKVQINKEIDQKIFEMAK